MYYLNFISSKKIIEVADFFFVDTTPFVLKYWNEPKDSTYDWRGVAPRETYIAKLLKVRNASAVVIRLHTTAGDR
jgi:hypothetical protein